MPLYKNELGNTEIQKCPQRKDVWTVEQMGLRLCVYPIIINLPHQTLSILSSSVLLFVHSGWRTTHIGGKASLTVRISILSFGVGLTFLLYYSNLSSQMGDWHDFLKYQDRSSHYGESPVQLEPGQMRLLSHLKEFFQQTNLESFFFSSFSFFLV